MRMPKRNLTGLGSSLHLQGFAALDTACLRFSVQMQIIPVRMIVMHARNALTSSSPELVATLRYDYNFEMGKLLAIDGLHIVRRVYEAGEASQEPDNPELVALALRHSLSSFRKLLSAHQPTHVLAAFDHEGTGWRQALYPAYRQHRTPMPAALHASLPGFYETLASIGVIALAVPEVEADDVIATAVLRWMAENKGEAIVASVDRDVLALLAHGASIWDHFKGEWHDLAWVEQKFGVTPAQLPDLFSLMGNPSHGIPGVPKVGIKAGARLLQSYGDLDGVMSGAGILMDTLGERLRKERSMLPIYRQLATLKTDVRLGVTWNRLAWDADLAD